MSLSNSIKFPSVPHLSSLQHKIQHYIESFEIMEFCNKWWNYIIRLFGISTSIICYNDRKSCIPLNFHSFTIILIYNEIFLFFPVIATDCHS